MFSNIFRYYYYFLDHIRKTASYFKSTQQSVWNLPSKLQPNFCFFYEFKLLLLLLFRGVRSFVTMKKQVLLSTD